MSADASYIDESEAALYDRQIRLWGVEAQNRMRNASVLLITLRGLATEVAKNLVLAGIGALTIHDATPASTADLGSGYFLRDTDVGQARAAAALHRLQALNPRVRLTASTQVGLPTDVEPFDLVCITDASPADCMALNEVCRQHRKPFYAASSYGLSGYIFADLIDHNFVVERIDRKSTSPDPPKLLQQRHQAFAPLRAALAHRFVDGKRPLRPKALKRMLPLFEMLALVQLQLDEATAWPPTADQLQQSAQALLSDSNIDSSILDAARLSALASMASSDFAPSCAILGGILAQDILNALGGREAPLINLLVFDGETNAGDIYGMGVEREAL